MHKLTATLDHLYRLCGAVAGACLVALITVIVLQMAARWSGFTFPGSTDYAGYLMAAASFFALAYAFAHGAHIRVNLLLSKLGRFRRAGEIWCLLVGTGLALYFAYFAVKANYLSWRINDISQGQDATPLWLPQLAMSVGTVVFAIALIDHLARAIFAGDSADTVTAGTVTATDTADTVTVDTETNTP